MSENRHIRRRVMGERKRPRAARGFSFPQLLAALLGFIAVTLQSLVVQTHIHVPQNSARTQPVVVIAASAGLSDVSLGHTDSPGGQYPPNRDSANCPLCKELTH